MKQLSLALLKFILPIHKLVTHCGMSSIIILPRDRQPEPKRNFPDSLPVDNQGGWGGIRRLF